MCGYDEGGHSALRVGGGYREMLVGNRAQGWRAICLSCCEGRTSTEQRDARQLTRLFAEAFLASARLTASQDKPRQIAARTPSPFSPMSPVKTIASMPSSAAIVAATCLRIAEHLNGTLRIGVCRRGFVTASHVAADVRNSQKAGTAVDQLFERCHVELPFTHQVNQNAWIEIAAARAHDHAAARGQSHARVDRFTGFDRVDAGAIAEVGDDQPLGQIVCQLAHDRFARETVKPVALDPFGSQFLGNRNDNCGRLGNDGDPAGVRPVFADAQLSRRREPTVSAISMAETGRNSPLEPQRGGSFRTDRPYRSVRDHRTFALVYAADPFGARCDSTNQR